MALIQCPECRKEISDKAPSCPHCGAPTTIVQPSAGAPSPTKAKKKTRPVMWVILVLIIVGAIWYTIKDQKGQREASLPPLPVQVQYRPAIVGPGLVLMVENRSDRYLSLALTLTNPSLNQQRNYRLDVGPHKTVTVGYREGWTLSSGDRLRIANNEYQPWEGSIP